MPVRDSLGQRPFLLRAVVAGSWVGQKQLEG
jgi:hypothetical protein